MENADLVAIRKLLEADKARKDKNQKIIGYVAAVFLLASIAQIAIRAWFLAN